MAKAVIISTLKEIPEDLTRVEGRVQLQGGHNNKLRAIKQQIHDSIHGSFVFARFS